MSTITTIFLVGACIAAYFALIFAFDKIRTHCGAKFGYQPRPIDQLISIVCYVIAMCFGAYEAGWPGSLIAMAIVLICWSIFYIRKTDILTGTALAATAPLLLTVLSFSGQAFGSESFFAETAEPQKMADAKK